MTYKDLVAGLEPATAKLFTLLQDREALNELYSHDYTERLKTNIAEKLFTKTRTTATGGFFYASKTVKPPTEKVEKLAAGAAYPTVLMQQAEMLYKEAQMVGLATEITKQQLTAEGVYAIQEAMSLISLAIGERRELLALAEVTAATPNFTAIPGSAWATGQNAINNIVDACWTLQAQDYRPTPNRMLVTSDHVRTLSKNKEFLEFNRPGDNPTQWGTTVFNVPGFSLELVVVSPDRGLPDPIVFDATLLGARAVPQLAGPHISARYYDRTEQSPGEQTNVWRIAGDDLTNYIVDRPSAAVVVTGTTK